MSTGTYFKTWRRFNGVVASESELDALKAEYVLHNAKHDYSEDNEKNAKQHEEDIPILLDVGFTADCGPLSESEYKTELPKAYAKDGGTLHLNLFEHFFGSGLPGLKQHYNLNPYKWSQSSRIIPLSDIKQILQAAKYLLCGEWSKNLDHLIGSSNPFLEVLGSDYPKWTSHNDSGNQKIYLDRESKESWTVSFGDS